MERDDGRRADRAFDDLPVMGVVDSLSLIGFSIAMTDAQGRVLDANEPFCDLVGRSRDELLALGDYAVLIPPEERARVAERRRRRAEGRRSEKVVTAMLHASGERIPVSAALITVALEGGESRVIAVLEDLRSSQARETVLDYYVALVERVPTGILVWSAVEADDPMAIRLVRANRAATESLGLDHDSIIGCRLDEVFPAVRADDAARMLALRDTNRVEHFSDIEYSGARTARRVYRWRAVAMPGGLIAALFEDVTKERANEVARRQLLERLVETSDEERRALAAGVHDDPVQQLAAAALLVAGLRRRPDSPERDERLEAVEASLRAAMESLRHLVFELSPPELIDSGLEAAVRSAADYLFSDAAIRVSVQVALANEPRRSLQTAAFRIASEALTNVRKHAEATEVSVTVTDDADALELSVVDNGRGLGTRSDEPGHIGLRSMRERAVALGGEWSMTAGPGGRGTSIRARLPLAGRPSVPAAVLSHMAEPQQPSELESLRRERDSLVAAAAEARGRAGLAEGRLREAMSFTAALLHLPHDEAQIAAVAAERIARAVLDGCVVRLLSEHGHAVTRAVSWHADPQQRAFFDRFAFSDEAALWGQDATVLRAGVPLLVDRETMARSIAAARQQPPVPIRSAIVAPLADGGAMIGTLTVVRDTTLAAFTDNDVDFVACLADRVAIALATARQRDG